MVQWNNGVMKEWYNDVMNNGLMEKWYNSLWGLKYTSKIKSNEGKYNIDKDI